ncbi:MAG: phospho-N-acetylmuramoyl-pentapeptide-transferase, partial [Oscillospiraceae bacterium]|nr:phospho-N-acetylmuramoyl-pentapeptide-transferase [Oscillospiraceae bacterium]
LTQVKLAAGILLALLCRAVGFMDDYIKVVKKQNLGLTGKQKLLFQTLVAAGYALSLYMARGSELNVPFVGLVDFHIWFVPFCAFTIVAMVNATNLTDGLDGLCTGVSMLSIAFFTLAAALAGYFGQTLFGVCVVGALLGFFLWNRHPARVIMGDLGSLFIGGTLCALAFGVGQPFLLLPAGIIYLIETLSVSLQVLYFKATHGKRLFKMSPIHHHLEMSGYSEWGIVGLFSLITLLGCVVAYFLL